MAFDEAAVSSFVFLITIFITLFQNKTRLLLIFPLGAGFLAGRPNGRLRPIGCGPAGGAPNGIAPAVARRMSAFRAPKRGNLPPRPLPPRCARRGAKKQMLWLHYYYRPYPR
jgi:hypothetical protein